nr:MAG TPA: hypothetical protein [Caudoviricetes sp.]
MLYILHPFGYFVNGVDVDLYPFGGKFVRLL